MQSENPFKGPKSYSDGEAFYGREREIDELYNLIRNETLTLLFSRSGTGKSSLLKAGIISKLRRELEFLPVYIHLNASVFNADPAVNLPDFVLSDYVIKECEKEIEKLNPKDFDISVSAITNQGSLFEFIHGLQILLNEKSDDGSITTFKIKPLLIFDQFEEIFTQPFKTDHLDFLYNEIRYLVENEVPVYLTEAFNNSSDNEILKLKNTLKSKQKDYRMLFAFREEYLPQFESLKRKIPSIKFTNSRFRLEPFSIETSKEIIVQTAPNVSKLNASIVSKSLSAKILGFDQPMDDPFLLSVICLGIYPELVGKNDVSELDIKSLVDNAIENYLIKVYTEIHDETKNFIEKRLITADGTKNSVNYNEINKNDILKKDIDKLIDDQDFRLLSKGQFLDYEQVSILHDRLLPPLLKFRNDREEKEKALKQRKKIIVATSFVVIACLLLLTVLLFKYKDDQMKFVDTNVKIANKSIDLNGNFIDAYTAIKLVHNLKSILLSQDSIKKRIGSLSTTLLFHVVTPKIAINNNLIIYNDGNKLKVSKVDDFKVQKSFAVFNRFITNWGYSVNTPQYWTADTNKSIDKQSRILKYVIDNKKLDTSLTFVARTYKPTADYDIHGNLYYLKEGVIYRSDSGKIKSVPFINLKKLIRDTNIKRLIRDSNQSFDLKFLSKEDRNPSDFLRISVKDRANEVIGTDPTMTFVIDILNKKYFKIIPQGIDFYVDQNKRVFYTVPSADNYILIKNVRFRERSDTTILTADQSFHEYFVNTLRNKGKINKLDNPSPSHSQDNKFNLSYNVENPNWLKIVDNGKYVNKQLCGEKDKIITFQALGSYFVFLRQSKKDLNTAQFVVFETYDFKHKQEFNIPKNWSFYYFKDSVMVFQYNNKIASTFDDSIKGNNQFNQLGMLVMNSEMTKNDSRDSWDNWNRLMEWEKKERDTASKSLRPKSNSHLH